MPRYALKIEYDGVAFHGWQAQKGTPSVQRALEEACLAYCGEQVVFFGAGRTDSGVHALGQVAHMDLIATKEPKEIQDAINFHLQKATPAVSILCAKKVAEDFHARFSATQRHYIYILQNRVSPSVLWRNHAWWIAQPLNMKMMSAVAEVFIGHHDWTTFRSSHCQAPSPIKTLNKLSVEQKGEQIIFRAQALSFLHHQVRSLVGALVEAGRGKLSPTRAGEVLALKNRSLCPALAPAKGLYLAKIEYKEEQ